VKHAFIADNLKRFVSRRDETAGETRDNIIVVFDATHAKIRRHFVHPDSFVWNLAGCERCHGASRTEKRSQPGQQIARVFVGAADFKFVFRRPENTRVVSPRPRSHPWCDHSIVKVSINHPNAPNNSIAQHHTGSGFE